MSSDMANDTQAMERRVICGHVFCVGAQAGRFCLLGRVFDALKMLKVVDSMERTMSEQLKFVPRRHIFAIRTRVLTFWGHG